jgi:sulfonate transport system permease protein
MSNPAARPEPVGALAPVRATRSGVGAHVESVALLALLVALWWAATHAQWVSRVFLPTPEATFSALAEGLARGDLAAQTGATIGRMLLGWGLASLLGVLLGALIGVSAVARAWIAPTLEFIRPLPASAIMPLAISIFGLSGGMVLFVVAFGAMWPVLLATVHGLASVHAQLREVAQGLEMPRRDFVWKIGLPNALPDILSGMRLSMTVALIVSVRRHRAAGRHWFCEQRRAGRGRKETAALAAPLKSWRTPCPAPLLTCPSTLRTMS